MTEDIVRLGSLYPTRDLNYVADTVEGFLLAAVSSRAIGSTINIGSGREISIGDLADLIIRLIGRPVLVESEAQRVRPEKSEVERLIADNTLAQNLLGWKPSVSLEEGLSLTIDWMREHLERYRPGVYVL